MNKIKALSITLAFLGLAGLAPATQAAVQHLNLPVCSLAVYPFNPDTPEIYGAAGTALINKLTEAVCKSRTPYNSPYNQPPQVNQNPLKNVANIENKNVPYATHLHTYVNNALEDNYYYRSYVDKFEIQLESDALSKMEGALQCTTPAPGSFNGSANAISDCNGSINDENFYGGVSVSFNSSTGTVTWEFGTVNKNLRPNMWGNNDSNPSDSDNFNEVLTAVFGTQANLADYNSVYRSFTPSVTMKTKNNSGEIWSATTTSRVLIRNYAILKSSFNAISGNSNKINSLCTTAGDYTKWCPVATPSGQGFQTVQLGNNGQQQWFWFPIGSVVSVWRKPPTPPALACADLTWDGSFGKKNSQGNFVPANDGLPNSLKANQEALMYVKPVYESGPANSPKRPVEYHWVSFQTNRPTWFTNADSNTMTIIETFENLGNVIDFNTIQLSQASFGLIKKASAQIILNPDPDVQINDNLENNTLNLLSLGLFKDTYNSAGNGSNPIVDFDTVGKQTIYYSGGSAGVTVGVQAFYSDGLNVPGDGPMVQTSNGNKQKAEPCHLEFKIQQPPAVCTGLTINPSSLAANTATTFTVTPSFSPSGQTIPLNYLWDASLNNINGSQYGTFKNSQGTAGNGQNIFLETVDNQTYYSGGPGGVRVRVQGFSKDGDAFPLCKQELIIPNIPNAVCELLDMDLYLVTGNGNVPADLATFEAGNTYEIRVDTANSVRTDDTPIQNYSIQAMNNVMTGVGDLTLAPGSPAQCLAVFETQSASVVLNTPVNCVYLYTPNEGDTITFTAVPDDNVPACKIQQTIPDTPDENPICEAINLRTNGSLGNNPLTSGGQSYNLTVDPRRTDDTSIGMVQWSENGAGQLVGDPLNNQLFPGQCPNIIDNQSVTTPSFCRYLYNTPAGENQSGGFSVTAVPNDGVANCTAQSNFFTPPDEEEEPYCLYLDLDYNPEPFNPLANPTNLTATVVLSDGSQYQDRVRFQSTDGSGDFAGGFGSVSGSGTSNFRTGVDSTNSTRTVTFDGDNEDTGINITLADTTIAQSAACQRQLRPENDDYVCEEPPRIVKEDDDTYCSSNYGEPGTPTNLCWSINGGLFSNGTTSATGSCVNVQDTENDFSLEVEDCNPEFRNICYDRLTEEDEIPNIDKKLSKTSVGGYGRNISFSTTGSSNEKVYYQIQFQPENYVDGKLMNARIVDPAFDGKIIGYKYKDTNRSTGVEADVINVDMNSIRVYQGDPRSGADQLEYCPANFNKEEDLGEDTPCFRLETSNEFQSNYNSNGAYMAIYGIDSNESIWIEYNGTIQRTAQSLSKDNCADGTFCQERFYNQSFVTDMEYCEEETVTDDEGNETTTWNCEYEQNDNPRCEYYYNERGERVSVNGNDQDCDEENLTIATPPTYVELVCQYFLTRASGDVFLEDKLVYGVDVSKCYPFRNTTSTIVKVVPPVPPELGSTGSGDGQVVQINNEICKAGQNNFSGLGLNADQIAELSKLYGSNIVENLSSTICEIGLVPGSDWDKDVIRTTIDRNISKLTRWVTDFVLGNSITDLNAMEQVYYYNGETAGTDTVTLKAGSGDLVLNEGSGAKTIIIENADLYIGSNITYGASSGEAIDQDKIASLGVIVINGNIYVDPAVKQLSGAFFVQRVGDDYANGGNLVSAGSNKQAAVSQVPLTINGSVYGNVGPLFENREASGDINQDQGAITIRYDQRIILNTPPGLSELFGDFSQSQIAR